VVTPVRPPVNSRGVSAACRTTIDGSAQERAWAAAAVPDPEVPVLTIEDLGVLRSVDVADDGAVHVTITPTYSGCPAMDTIRADVLTALGEAGFADVTVELVLSPAWTTDWMSEAGKEKLRDYGIAPPQPRAPGGAVPLQLSLRCPQCGSPDTHELSRFGSTACKSLWVCDACREPFDHFKTI
jgi:ring-1,2-phenylacetyl-CoA epoxidase subunit PaaD